MLINVHSRFAACSRTIAGVKYSSLYCRVVDGVLLVHFAHTVSPCCRLQNIQNDYITTSVVNKMLLLCYLCHDMTCF